MDWSPYDFNGGTLIGIAGENFSLLASDTRLSEGFSILSRDCPRIRRLNKSTALGSVGFHGDVLSLAKNVDARMKFYAYEHNVEMSTAGAAQMLSTMLYYRRFFPYYVYNVLAGVDESGAGCLYSYDPVGSYESVRFIAAGSSAALLQPLLDNQVGRHYLTAQPAEPLTKERALNLAHDAFVSAAERDIITGDSVFCVLVTKAGFEEHTFQLRKD